MNSYDDELELENLKDTINELYEKDKIDFCDFNNLIGEIDDYLDEINGNSYIICEHCGNEIRTGRNESCFICPECGAKQNI
jgi:RNA polymerase-binding transcription factor DksA